MRTKRPSPPPLSITTRRVVYVHLPPEENTKEKNDQFWRALFEYGGMVYAKTKAYGIRQPKRVMITTLADLGFKHGMSVDDWRDYARRNQLRPCLYSTAVRLAFRIEEISPKLPREFFRRSWWLFAKPTKGNKYLAIQPSSDGKTAHLAFKKPSGITGRIIPPDAPIICEMRILKA